MIKTTHTKVKNTKETKDAKNTKDTTETKNETKDTNNTNNTNDTKTEELQNSKTLDENTETGTQIEESNTEIFFNKLNNQFQDVISIMKTLQSNFKVLQKEVTKERKEIKKKEMKHSKNNIKRKPNGFAKPSLISDELADFLNIPRGSELARTEATSKIISYVKENHLQNPEKKKEFILDDKLKSLLKPGPNDIIGFFTLQTFLKSHFPPSKNSITDNVTVV
jgi:chromatin remodeling complex protein RSC6